MEPTFVFAISEIPRYTESLKERLRRSTNNLEPIGSHRCSNALANYDELSERFRYSKLWHISASALDVFDPPFRRSVAELHGDRHVIHQFNVCGEFA